MINNCKFDLFINHHKYSLEIPEQSGESIKKIASIPPGHSLYLGDITHSDYEKDQPEIPNDKTFTVCNGQHFWSREPRTRIAVTINCDKYHFRVPSQLGSALKERAGIELTDVLFRSGPCEDEVIPNNIEITLNCGDCFYSSPPADYGSPQISSTDVCSDQFECLPGPDGWTFLVIQNFRLPKGYTHTNTEVLVKLPPGFPDAAPDMFWTYPHLKTDTGGVPQGTSEELLLGKQWQRFSWHMVPGSWRPGISSLRDFIRCIRSRFERLN